MHFLQFRQEWHGYLVSVFALAWSTTAAESPRRWPRGSRNAHGVQDSRREERKGAGDEEEEEKEELNKGIQGGEDRAIV